MSELVKLPILVVGNRCRTRRLLHGDLCFAIAIATATATAIANTAAFTGSRGAPLPTSVEDEALQQHVQEIRVDDRHEHVALSRTRDAAHASRECPRPSEATRPVLSLRVAGKPATPC